MMARAIAPRAPANRNDLSEVKRLLPEQSGHLSRPRRSGQATKFSPGSSNRDIAFSSARARSSSRL